VLGPSLNREQAGPLSLAARLGLYAMLAGLVLASFTVTPERRAPVLTTLADGGPNDARIAPISRGFMRGLRDDDENDPMPSSPQAPTLEVAVATRVEAVPDTLPEVLATPEPSATPEAAPDPTPDPTPKPTTPPPPRPFAPPVAVLTNPSTLSAEVRMLALVNASRAQGALVPLSMDIGVADTARAHSAAEAQVRYVYHDGPDGTAASRNVPACATAWYGENTGKIWNNNVDALHIEFMNEPWIPINHRTNIMDPAFRRVGIGAVIGADAMYMTMVFCR
jgi:uncharacterized protein YkwD